MHRVEATLKFFRNRHRVRVGTVVHWLGLHQFSVLVSMMVLFGGAWVFIELADDIMERETASIDERVLLSLRNPVDRSDPLGPGWVEEIGRDITALGGTAVLALITLAAFFYLVLQRKFRAAIFTIAAIGGGVLLSTLLKIGFDRPRPDLVPHESIVYTASFPSGHAMLSAITYLTLAALLSRIHSNNLVKTYLMAVAVLFTLLVGTSRVYLGVHWPTDVLAGWTAGAAWAAFMWLLERQLQRIGLVEGESENERIDH
ncbi:MAG: phosphatase PAP2 family protein [Proteobacteria bacterium]|nr:phosphatase PAP2 family protein [Pseudomonadota bacterium]